MPVELWKSIFDWMTVVLIALTVLSGAGAIITGDIIGKRQEGRSHQFEKELTESQTELRKQEERADTAAGKLAGLEHDAAEAKSEMAKQQTRAATAEHSLLQLQRRMEPRRISTDQKTRLIAMLSHGPKGKAVIGCVVGDADGCTLAEDIAGVLKASGWETGVNQNVYTGGPPPVGISVHIRNGATVPPSAILIQQAFFSVGISLPGVIDPAINEGIVEIVVGNKPQS